MDHELDEPKISVDVHRRTSQVNLWMIVAIIAFLGLAGFYIARVNHHPPQSIPEMRHGSVIRFPLTHGLC